MSSSEKNQIRSELLKIGDCSMFIISESHRLLGKGKLWEEAVLINKIAKNLHQSLEESYIPNRDAIREEKGWADYYNNPFLR